MILSIEYISQIGILNSSENTWFIIFIVFSFAFSRLVTFISSGLILERISSCSSTVIIGIGMDKISGWAIFF